MPIDELPTTAFRFDVRITVDDGGGLAAPLCAAAFSECDGLELNLEPRTVREGGNNTQTPHLVGPVSYGTLTLKRGMTSNRDLWRWFAAASSGSTRGVTAECVVVQRDSRGLPFARYRLRGCLPVKLKAPALSAGGGAVAVEEFQLAYASLVLEEF